MDYHSAGQARERSNPKIDEQYELSQNNTSCLWSEFEHRVKSTNKVVSPRRCEPEDLLKLKGNRILQGLEGFQFVSQILGRPMEKLEPQTIKTIESANNETPSEVSLCKKQVSFNLRRQKSAVVVPPKLVNVESDENKENDYRKMCI
jgi:hypothetical protein